MSRKLTDVDVTRIRERAAEGAAQKDLAEEFSVSERYIRRLVRGDARPQLGGLDRDTAIRDVRAAVDRFLAGLDLDPAQEVDAAAARALADKLDALGSSQTAGAAAAAPLLARELLATISELRGDVREPDELDEIRGRREARLLASRRAASAEG